MAVVLVVGGAGFVGSHLVRQCLHEGDSVHVIVRPSTDLSRLHDLLDRIHLHVVRLDDNRGLRRSMSIASPELIFHLAVSTRRKPEPHLGDAFASVTEDLLGLIAVLAAAADTTPAPRMLIRTGSLAVYGDAPIPHLEVIRERPKSVYAAGLVAGAHYAEALQSRLPFPVVTARLSLVYGPGQSDEFLIPSLISRCLRAQKSLVQNPRVRRDIIFVDDVVKALQCICRSELPGGFIVNVASGHAPTMQEVAQCIVENTAVDPDLVAFRLAGRTHEVDLVPSPSLAEQRLGWKARVPLDEGIGLTVDWWKNKLAASGKFEDPRLPTIRAIPLSKA